MRTRSGIALLGLVGTIVAALLGIAASANLRWPTGLLPFVYGSLGVVFAAVGWLIVDRRPGNLIGPILLLFGFGLSTYIPLDAYLREPDAGPGADLVALTIQSLDVPSFTLLALALLLFPDGRLPSESWRIVYPFTLVVIVIGTVGIWLDTAPVLLFPSYHSPIGIAGFPGGAIVLVAYAGMLMLFLAATASLVVRWRRGRGLERTQIKWIAAAAVVALVAELVNVVTFRADDPNGPFALIASVALTLIPISIGIAILRYRLYDIDRIISRTLSYAIVTGLLGAVFVGVILVLQTALAGVVGTGGIPVAVSTLAVFALFQPVLRRVRRAVDRRFDRARYDGERTAGAFAERLRWETDMDRVTGDLRATVASAVVPEESRRSGSRRPGAR